MKTVHNKNKQNSIDSSEFKKPEQLSEKETLQADDIERKKKLNEELGIHIGKFLELERNFKLYSYRIISPEMFIEQSKNVLQS